jgi:hypothetical protein
MSNPLTRRWRSNCLAVALCLAHKIPEIDSVAVFRLGDLARLDGKLTERSPHGLLSIYVAYLLEQKIGLGPSFEHLSRFTLTEAGRELVIQFARRDSKNDDTSVSGVV